ncbi:MAG: AAA family ATPase [Candidatus Limnocylindrales bacterium]
MNRAGSVLSPVLVGRDDLLERADNLISEATAGRGQALFLSGPAGLGKTRLRRSIGRKAMAVGLRVEGGDVAPQDQHVPMASILEMARSMQGNPEIWGTLGADLLAIQNGRAADALGSRRLLVRETADRILAAMDVPTLLVFDDLHWTDEMSLEVIGELARHISDKPVFLLGGYRADEFPAASAHREWRARLLSQRHAEEATLRPLTYDETATVTTLILGTGMPAPREVVAAIHERTDGIPLHIEELLAALDDEARADGQRIWEAHVPDTIGDAVITRLNRLSDEARAVARAGAVIGRCFVPDVIAGMTDRTVGELDPVIQELVDAAILYPFEYIDRGYYDFRHQLLRDAIYDTVPPAQLRRFHAQVAEFGMTLDGASIVHASRHFEQAGLRPQAFRAALTAARSAAKVSARRESFELFKRAVDNMPRDLPDAEKGDLYYGFSDAAGEVERHDESLRAAKLAREHYRTAGQPEKAAEVLINIWSVHRRSVAPSAALVQELDDFMLEVKDLPPTPDTAALQCIALLCRAHVLIDAARIEEALAVLAEVRGLATRAGDRKSVLEADLLLDRAQVVVGQASSAMPLAFQAAREAREAGYESVGVSGFRSMADVAVRVLDYGSARLALEEGLRYADEIEASHCRQQMAVTTALLAWADGRWDEAFETARQELVERGCRLGELGATEVLGLIAMGRAELAGARHWLGTALEGGLVTGDACRILPSLWGLAELDLVQGKPVDAIARCEEALLLVEASQEGALLIPFFVTAARAAIAAQRPGVAELWLARAAVQVASFGAAAPAIAHARGLLQLAAGSTGLARESLSEALAGWTRLGRGWETAWARLDLAAAHLRAGRFADAAPLAAEARDWAEAAGAAPIVARADELARMGRGRIAPDEPWRPLSSREFEVARHIAAGLTNGEIADELIIAPKTVSAHVEHILAKLGATRRAEIAAWTATVSGQVAKGAVTDGAMVTAHRR